jgi:eukaryotic-like serine/threonine-protein kinase
MNAEKIAPENIVDFASRRRASIHTATGAKPKLLFVDDEERILNAMRALFRSHYDVVVTTDGYHALELLKRDRFHLLVSDQRMPGMLGIEILRQAKEISPNTVRILLTGFSDLAAIVGSVNDGEVYRFINKPWDNQELQGIIADAVRIGVELADVPPIVPARGAESRVLSSSHAEEGVIVLESKLDILRQVCDMLPTCRVIHARNASEALEIMTKYEIGIIVSSTEGRQKDELAFFSLLKREHPQIITIVVAHSGDSESVIDLINNARIFRYVFKPIKEGLLHQYLKSALTQYRNFKALPKLLLQQSVPIQAGASQSSPPGQALVAKMRGLRSFFTKK